MASVPAPFYGCLCLETSNINTQPQAGSRQAAGLSLPEIHFNIWENPDGKGALLDVGLMLDFNDPAEKIELFLPWDIKQSDVEDLSSKILAANGVSAVFNESWTSSISSNRPGASVTKYDGTVFTIVPYSPIRIVQRNLQSHTFFSIAFDVPELKRVSLGAAPGPVQPQQMYVRLRVKNVPPSFYRVGIDQGDALGGGALTRTEIIDFRMNVRRGAPPGIEVALAGRFLEFSKVHLFLMKARDHDIVFEDKLFKACRSLEDEEFWATYILSGTATQNDTMKSRKRVENSLGYQWRKTPEIGGVPVAEFGMLARFKSFQMRKKTVAVFIGLALLFGLIGNGLYDVLKNWAAPQDNISSTNIDGKSTGASLNQAAGTGTGTGTGTGKAGMQNGRPLNASADTREGRK